MRVVLLHQYYKTPLEGGGIRSWYLARALREAGHEVEVVTAWNGKSKSTALIDGVRVHYLPIFYDNKLGKIRRLLSFLLFAISSTRTIMSLPRPDLLYAISTPLSTGLVALYLRRKIGLPFIFEVGDLWPEVPLQMGIITHPGLARTFKRAALDIYKRADRIVAMSPAMEEYFKVLGHDEKTICVTNFSDMTLSHDVGFGPLPAGEFRIVYTGAMGKAHQLDYLLALAEEAKNRRINGFRCIIMGEGAEKERLQLLAKQKGLGNVEFLPHGSKSEAIHLLSTASMAYLSFAPFDMLWTGSPNKYFDALAIGKPVLCNFGGWVGSEIATKRCGVTYDGRNPAQFFDHHWPALQQGGTLEVMGKNALTLAESKYSLDLQLSRWLKLFEA